MILKYEAPYEIKAQLQGDVGLDIKSIEDVVLRPGETRVVKTGLKVELPAGYEAQVRPKSSLSGAGILIHLGTVDNGYRGDITIVMTNLTSEVIEFDKLQKVAQLVIKKYENDIETIEAEEVNQNTERGITGFGSSGKF